MRRMLPLPISTPISVPNTWPITPPGPNNGLKNGNEHISPIANNPQILPANGDMNLANKSPIPDPE